jgi:uncharacterized membrane protein YbaN (DUF454 family)
MKYGGLSNPVPAFSPSHQAGHQLGELLEIELDSKLSQLVVIDARLFGPSQRSLSRRLVKALCARNGVRRVGVDSENFTCRVDFDISLNSPAAMAEIFKESLQSASIAHERRWWFRSPRWSTLIAYRHHGDVLSWEIHRQTRESIRLVHQGWKQSRAYDSDLADRIASLEGVKKCLISRWSRRITVILSQGDAPFVQSTLSSLESILEGRGSAELSPGDILPGRLDSALVSRWKRPLFVLLAGGTFALALIGLVVPGVPTIWCLLATSYFLARSSPWLNESLLHMPYFGPILREWEGHGALSTASKAKLVVLTIAMISVTVALAPLTPLALGIILLISSLSVYGIARMPTLVEDIQADAGPLTGITPSPEAC